MQLELNTGATIPRIGLGTWHLEEGKQTIDSVLQALRLGYRLIDTARLYDNEHSVGEAIKQSGVPRGEIFVTTKLWNNDHGYDNALRAFDDSLKRLGMDYVDLYLIHWPASEELRETWQALCEIYQQGRAKAIGVSNYSIMHLQELFAYSDIAPAVNQLEFHPFVGGTQKSLVQYCLRRGLQVMAYSPLARSAYLDNPVIADIARRAGKAPAQVMLHWAIQHGTIPIPKSSNPNRIKENLDVFDFELDDQSMRALDNLS